MSEIGDMKETYQILWIDDDRPIIQLLSNSIKKALKEQGLNIDVDIEGNPGDGVIQAVKRAASGHPYHLVICDLDFRKCHDQLDGIDVIEGIRKDLPTLPVLIFSGHLDRFATRIQELHPIPIHFDRDRDHDELISILVHLLVHEEPRILHLSDLHFGIFHGFNDLQYSLEETFFKPGGEFDSFLGRKKPNLVIVSGDLGSTGESTDYDRPGYESAKTFLTHLLEKLSLGTERCLIVPGNHDIHLLAPRGQEWISFSKFLSGFYRKGDNDYGTLSNYSGAEKIRDLEPLEQKDLMSLHRYERLRASFFCMNSNEVEHLNKAKSKANKTVHGFVDVQQLFEAKSFFSGTDYSYLRVAVLHHPIYPVPDAANKLDQDRIVGNWGLLLRTLSDCGVHLVLHGHSHYPAIQTYRPILLPGLPASNQRRPLHVIAAGSMGAEFSHRRPAFPFFHYQLISTRMRSSYPNGGETQWEALIEARQLKHDSLRWEYVAELGSSMNNEELRIKLSGESW
jgi:CheY-like chemotaxis protein/predicted MPP superfamily phosphohydrolase